MRADVYIITEPGHQHPIAVLALPESQSADGVGLARLTVPISAKTRFALDSIDDLLAGGTDFEISDFPIDTVPMARVTGTSTTAILRWASSLALQLRETIASALAEEFDPFAKPDHPTLGMN